MKPAAVLATFLLFPSVFALAQTRPEFEVASIKLNTSATSPAEISTRPEGLIARNIPLRGLITNAYNIRNFQLAGDPDWLSTDRYDITAKTETKVSQDELRLMLQSLFADRLKLAVHRETREETVYELRPSKGGLKLTPTTEGSCQKFDRDHPPPPSTPGGPLLNLCGFLGGVGQGRISAWDLPMERFVATLSNMLGRMVIDKTGATGNYNFHLEYDPATTGGTLAPGGPVSPPPPADSASPNIFTALQEQLGIKAESAKGPVEMVIIDHVERPSEN